MKAKFINHASLLLTSKCNKYLYLDPWILSTAFSRWFQDPPANAQDILDICSLNRDDITIIISHGHDDHLDEFIIKSSIFRNCSIIIPQLETKGLKRRIERLGCKKIIEVGEQAIEHNGFLIQNLINKEFTGDDTIFLISDEEHLLIHANDNWHRYNKTLLSQIEMATSRFSEDSIYYLVQLGIADAFPYSYADIEDQECEKTARNRYLNYSQTINDNARQMSFKKIYTYANESCYNSKIHRMCKNSKELRQEVLDANKEMQQLLPGTALVGCSNHIKDINQHDSNLNIIEYCLDIYYQKSLDYIVRAFSHEEYTTGNPLVNYHFALDCNAMDASLVYLLSADRATWQEILTGKLTIEAITIGGAGIIYKDPGINVSPLHHALTKWCYKAQSEILQNGFNWYLQDQ